MHKFDSIYQSRSRGKFSSGEAQGLHQTHSLISCLPDNLMVSPVYKQTNAAW